MSYLNFCQTLHNKRNSRELTITPNIAWFIVSFKPSHDEIESSHWARGSLRHRL